MLNHAIHPAERTLRLGTDVRKNGARMGLLQLGSSFCSLATEGRFHFSYPDENRHLDEGFTKKTMGQPKNHAAPGELSL